MIIEGRTITTVAEIVRSDGRKVYDVLIDTW